MIDAELHIRYIVEVSSIRGSVCKHHEEQDALRLCQSKEEGLWRILPAERQLNL